MMNENQDMNNISDNPMIQVRKLYKTYYSGRLPLEVLKGVDLNVGRGEIVAIVGESGCGKSTLLNLIGGLDDITSGSVLIAGEDINKMNEDELSHYRNQKIGFIFQFHHLLPDFTALENVMLPFLAHRYHKHEAREKAVALLREVKLEPRLDHRPNQLSGGEQQRVAIARAFINNPAIIFADEPTGNLDEKTSEEIRELLWSLRDQHNLTIILVTHDEAKSNLADRKVKLAYGRIQDVQRKV